MSLIDIFSQLFQAAFGRRSFLTPVAKKFVLLAFLIPTLVWSNNVVIIIIDGARYSETFGDVNRTYIPRMNQLAQEGSYLDHFYNDSLTYTSRAIPALWCGTWTPVRDTVYNGSATNYAVKPTIFEYFRKQTSAPAEQAYYVLKYVSSLWLPSFQADYGPQYWPTFISQGSTDDDVLDQTLAVLNNHHPQLLWVYLADVDHGGHSGNWQEYTEAIQKADSIVGIIWDTIQSDSIYANNTTMFVTNDHGRHDDQHGGFQGHGDGCDGCRHIMFLACGPDIRRDFMATQYHRIPDLAVTALSLFDIVPEFATGAKIDELFITIATQTESIPPIPEEFALLQNYPNPFNPVTTIKYNIPEGSAVSLIVYDITGRQVIILADNYQDAGYKSVQWDGRNSSGQLVSTGIYLYRVAAGASTDIRKMLFLH
ncbi:MAG: alkaline phosphatase family protein [Candidatus Marinimicrobia bacterium]|nr:alkaline phosphatase family protein [Candidatus Neomarinimicrobiota bacterium]